MKDCLVTENRLVVALEGEKGQEGSFQRSIRKFGADRDVQCLDCANTVLGVYLCQTLSQIF